MSCNINLECNCFDLTCVLVSVRPSQKLLKNMKVWERKPTIIFVNIPWCIITSLSCICYILLIIIPHTDHPFDELPVCPAWYFKDCNLSVSRSISQLINMLLSTFLDSWQCIQRLTFNIEYYFKLIKILYYILKYFFLLISGNVPVIAYEKSIKYLWIFKFCFFKQIWSLQIGHTIL